MPQSERESVDAIAGAIAAYLDAHPAAVDTVEGVANWWLVGRADEARVQYALDHLVRQGWATCMRSPDGRLLYGRTRQ